MASEFKTVRKKTIKTYMFSQSVKLLITLNHVVFFDQIMHHSARNGQFAFGVRVSVSFHLRCVHIIFSSVSVAEWPPFGK